MHLHSDMSKVVLPIDYYYQYNSYITQNEDDLLDVIFENMVGYKQYRSLIKVELKSAIEKGFWTLSGNQHMIHSDILACVMQKMGVLL